MTIYEAITMGLIALGLLVLVLALSLDRLKKQVNEDERAMDDESFKKQVSLINEKILELNDYHMFMKDELEKKHKELLFLYQMVSEKEKTLKQMTESLEQSSGSKEGKSTKEPILRQESDINLSLDPVNKSRRILDLKEEGYDEKQIAKIMGIGQGEVRLVLNLYD